MKFILRLFRNLLLGFAALVLIFLSVIFFGYHMFYKPEPTISTFKLENEQFCLGHACHKQPKTLQEYAEFVSGFLFRVYDARLMVWPEDAYKDQLVYLVSSDKKQAWKIDMANKIFEVIPPEQVPGIERVHGKPDQFFPNFPKDGMPYSYVQVIDLEKLLDEQDSEGIYYLGRYKVIMLYLHEGFHITGQGDENRFTRPEEVPDELFASVTEVEKYDNFDARVVRSQILNHLTQALTTNDVAEKEVHTQAAVAAFLHYKKTFPKEEKAMRYMDKTEGTASYVEIASTFIGAHENINTYEDLINVVPLFYSRPFKPGSRVGAVREAYSIGLAASFLLDYYHQANPDQWKNQLIDTPEATSMSLLADYYLSVNGDVVDYTPPSAELVETIRKVIEAKPKNY